MLAELEVLFDVTPEPAPGAPDVPITDPSRRAVTFKPFVVTAAEAAAVVDLGDVVGCGSVRPVVLAVVLLMIASG